uniref:Uncharacterized protein n=1 Tax=Trypanosoma congolense (strain IL3000) TaxID=1068625 RepID=G0UUB7_TRYCI|nr:hypothetical protein TCIL3000_9_3810 [Trypanosoma congolense IL3000]
MSRWNERLPHTQWFPSVRLPRKESHKQGAHGWPRLSPGGPPLYIKFPRLAAHGALRAVRFAVRPALNAVNVKGMCALSSDNRTTLSRHPTLRTTRLKVLPTDAACVLPTIPHPAGHKMCALYFYIHHLVEPLQCPPSRYRSNPLINFLFLMK